MVASIRKQLTDKLTPLLPGIKIIPSSRNVDVPSKPFAQITLMEFQRLPEAPVGNHLVQFTVTIVTPLTTPQLAEDNLDALVADLVYGIDQLDNIYWTEAKKVVFSERNLAYDVTVFAVSEKN